MADKQVTVVAEFQAKDGMEGRVKQTLMNMVSPTRNEPSNINYDLHQGTEDPKVFYLYENWLSQAALDEHMQMPYFKQMDKELEETLVKKYTVTILEMTSQKEDKN